MEGCFGCRAGTVSFGTVPGGSRDSKNGVSKINEREQDLFRYREKRKAGEQPDGTSRAAMAKSDHKMRLWEAKEKEIVEDNPPEMVKQVKKALTNLK